MSIVGRQAQFFRFSSKGPRKNSNAKTPRAPTNGQDDPRQSQQSAFPCQTSHKLNESLASSWRFWRLGAAVPFRLPSVPAGSFERPVDFRNHGLIPSPDREVSHMKRNLAKFLTMSASFVATMPLLQTCGFSLPGIGDITID